MNLRSAIDLSERNLTSKGFEGLGFRGQGLGFRGQGLGFRDSCKALMGNGNEGMARKMDGCSRGIEGMEEKQKRLWCRNLKP